MLDLGIYIATLVGFATIASPFVLGLTEGIKNVFPTLPNRFYPIVSIVVGEIILVGLALETGRTWDFGASAGFVAGLAAAGLYQSCCCVVIYRGVFQ